LPAAENTDFEIVDAARPDAERDRFRVLVEVSVGAVVQGQEPVLPMV
jgi:hypothetical protein